MIGPFIHNIDPIFAQVGGFYLWWYGLTYTLGFLGVFVWLKANRTTLSMNINEVYNLTISIAIGLLVGGRMVEVIFYESSYYSSHLWHIPAIWIGGMSTHGILLGSIIGIVLYSKLKQRSFFEITDVLVISGALIMGLGRIGNFIDGQIVGSLTEMWWGVKFPDVEGYRHPVVLYDGLKNLLLIPFLLIIKSTHPPRGVITAHFILWYGFLRIFIDFFREYRTDMFGFPPGQEFNLFMTVVGASLLFFFYRNRSRTKKAPLSSDTNVASVKSTGTLWTKRVLFVLLLIVPMSIPSDWTQDVPARYKDRHPDLQYSVLYPKIKSFYIKESPQELPK